MPTAKKAVLEDARIKLMVWGEPGSGKSRFSLTSPSPLVIDLEGSTRLYAGEFDFYVAEVDPTNAAAKNTYTLINTITRELLNKEYPEVKTLVIDPVTDFLDELESLCAASYERQIGKNIASLNALQKTKWYAYRRDKIRSQLDMLKNLPLNLILVARSRSVWAKGDDGQTTVTGDTYDANPIVESLMDVVINLKKSGHNEYSAEVKKSRIGNLPDTLPVKSYDSLLAALEESKDSKRPVVKKAEK